MLLYRRLHKLQSDYRKQIIYVSLLVVALAACLGWYYSYLTKLYLIDEHYHIDRLRQLSIDEKLTITTVAPNDFGTLNAFVLQYSICPYVYDIQIVWQKSSTPPNPIDFKYTTTHSTVSFKVLNASSHDTVFDSILDGSQIRTAAVFHLDADVLISCSDLAFSFSVWKSSQKSLVGFFPRIVRQDDNKKEDWEFHSAQSVIYSQEYNFMLYSGVIFSTAYLQSLSKQKHIKTVIAEHPYCADYVLPLWAHKQGALAPIWAEAEVKISEDASLLGFPACKQGKKSPQHHAIRRLKGVAHAGNESSSSDSSSEEESKHGVLRIGSHISVASSPGQAAAAPSCYVLTAKKSLTNEQRGECVGLIAKEFGITDDLPVFNGMARQAKNLLFW